MQLNKQKTLVGRVSQGTRHLFVENQLNENLHYTYDKIACFQVLIKPSLLNSQSCNFKLSIIMKLLLFPKILDILCHGHGTVLQIYRAIHLCINSKLIFVDSFSYVTALPFIDWRNELVDQSDYDVIPCYYHTFSSHWFQ